MRRRLKPDSWEEKHNLRLTRKQLSLLIHILLSQLAHSKDDEPIVWSPKRYLQRSPTKSESATLSKRLNNLVELGYVKRKGREVSVTSLGTKALLQAAKDDPKLTDIASEELQAAIRCLVAGSHMNAIWSAIDAAKEMGVEARHHRVLQEIEGVAWERYKQAYEELSDVPHS